MDIKAILLSNKYDKQKMKYAIKSFHINGIDIEIAGLNQPWNFINKIYWVKDYLEKYKNNDIMIFSDAFDVFYLTNLNEIKEKFINIKSKILFSSETCYSHQLENDKRFYDELSKNKSKYKYLNTGCCIGFKNDLFFLYSSLIEKIENDKKFMSEIRVLKPRNDGIDQTITSHYLVENYEKHDIKLDYDNVIFYVASVDWDEIDEFVAKDMKIIETKNKPCIIHVPFKQKYEYILKKLFLKKYKIRIYD